jgi:hypothetical protein
MKRIFTLLTIVAFTTAFGQLAGSMEEVVTALKSGNASQMARYFDNTVEITLPGKSSNFSKTQAEVVLKDFFSNNPIKGFEQVHKGENGGGIFCIGQLHTRSGTYRTTIYMKQRGDALVLQELKFER